jgi:tetratricopeptide (TPR) repeat protein
MTTVEDHPTQEALEGFLLGQLPAAEMRCVLRHLLTGCSLCQQVTVGLWEPEEEEDFDDVLAFAEASESVQTYDEYDEVFDRVFARVAAREASVTREREMGRELFEELMQHPAARQHLLVRNSARFRHRMLCEQIVQESFTTGFKDVSRSLELARLAVTLVELLSPEMCEGEEGFDSLRARAYGQLGNALRINQDFPSAEQVFETAQALVDQAGRVGLLDKARVLDLLASLRKDQRRFAEASQLLDRVGSIYRRLGQWHLLGRTLQQKSTVVGEAGDNEQEIALLRRALDLLDPQEEPRTFLAARHNLIYALNESGRSREAFALLFHTRPLYLKTGDRMHLLRLRWVEGMVAQGLNRIEQAEAAYREVRDAFLDLGLPYDAALAALDLASVYNLQGRNGEVCRIAEETLAVFRTNNMHREAIAALSFLSSTARMEAVEGDLVRRISAFLKAARNNPELRFAVSS